MKDDGLPPGEHYAGVGVACAGARWAPLDSVDLFTVCLEVVDAGLLLHTPDLHVKAPVKHHPPFTTRAATLSTERHLQGHVVGAGSQQHA